jgi:coenzyme F420 hydrogenase subunit beta
LAIESGVIDTAVTVKTDAGKLPVGFVSRGSADLLESAGSNYMAYPVLEAFNRVPRDSNEKIGVVVTPCQATALAKMRTNPPQERVNQANVSLVIGLFCTWALAYDRFYEFLKNNVDLHAVRKFDIPPPPANRFDVYLGAEMKSFPLEEVRQYRMPTCSYCLDMTAEFTDISVGSVEGIDGWNTVIVRTERGSSLIEEAVKKGKLETREIPLSCVEHLKEASLNKKARALQEIVNRTGDKNDLMYLSMNDSVKEKLLKRKVGSQGGH